MDTLLTVIIPVYKTEKTIDRCIESVVNQGGENTEIILVDDGSPDGCPLICDRWAAADSRISVIHKTNGGLGDARNKGIAQAKGRFVTFVDSDDYLAPGTLDEVMRAMERVPECDIMEYGIFKFYNSPHQHRLSFADRVYHDMDVYWLECRAYRHAYACNKVFRKDLFDDVRFPSGVAFEDIHTLPLLIEKSRTVATTGNGMYYYCWNTDGITNNAGAAEYRSLLDAHIKVMGHYWGKPGFTPYYMHVLDIQLYECALTGDAPRMRGMRCWDINGLGARSKVKALALNFLGIKILCKTYRLFHRIRKFLW